MDTVQYKCPNCNAELKFNPVNQKLTCEYCESQFTTEEIQEIYSELVIPDVQQVQNTDEFEEHTNLYHCSSCGADIMADDKQTATFCYYCHNPVVLSGKLTGDYKPSKVIGFKISRELAIDNFKQWCSKRKFVPKDFKSEQQIEKMTGLYVPFWVADCNVKVNFQAIGKQVRSWHSGNYRYTEVKEYSVTRQGKIISCGIPADGESKIDDDLMEAIEPFNYNELKDFDMSYLSGFYADKYDVDKAGVFPRIKQRASSASKQYLRSTINNYSSLAVNIEDYNIQKTDWSYMMLPVWFMAFRYKDKVYEFALNGQTGKLAGTPPLDKAKLRLFCTAIGAGITLLGCIIGGAL